jgi:hypothetical protein
MRRRPAWLLPACACCCWAASLRPFRAGRHMRPTCDVAAPPCVSWRLWAAAACCDLAVVS